MTTLYKDRFTNEKIYLLLFLKAIQFKTATKKPTRTRKRNVKKPIVKEESKRNTKPATEYMETTPFESTEIKTELVDQTAYKTNNASLHLEDLKEESTEFKAALHKIDYDDPINLLLSTSDNPASQVETSFELNQCSSENTVEIAMMSVRKEAALETNKNENPIDDKDDILLSLLDNDGRTNEVCPESEISLKKQELSSQIFSEVPSTSQFIEKEDSTDFLMSLID